MLFVHFHQSLLILCLSKDYNHEFVEQHRKTLHLLIDACEQHILKDKVKVLGILKDNEFRQIIRLRGVHLCLFNANRNEQ